VALSVYIMFFSRLLICGDEGLLSTGLKRLSQRFFFVYSCGCIWWQLLQDSFFNEYFICLGLARLLVTSLLEVLRLTAAGTSALRLTTIVGCYTWLLRFPLDYGGLGNLCLGWVFVPYFNPYLES
jgi:hypothetical protein